MTYKDLPEFISDLEQRGQLIRIKTSVSRDLEITEIADRVMKGAKDKNKALLFENVQGFSTPVAINLFGSNKRMSLALGVNDLEELNQRLAKLVDMRLPQGLGAMIDRATDFFGVLKSIGLGPAIVSHGTCQEVIEKENPSLESLPILKCWPGDAGRFITLMQVITRDPTSNARNVGMYRLQVLSDKKLAMHWQRHKGGAEHERKAREVGAGLVPAQNAPAPKIPCAIVLGGDFIQIRQFMPDDLTGKIIVTNTTTAKNVEELRKRNLHILVTVTPRLEGRSFGTNVMEATLLALMDKPQAEVADTDFLELIEFVKQVQPKRVFTLHGFAADFAETLRDLGFDARPLSEADQLTLPLFRVTS